ncbi:MAG: formylmethanofuran dehydrogenase subunit C [Xanthobacteraceae bacterium]
MKPLTFTLRQRPDQRLDLSPLVPHLISGRTTAQIERIELQTTRRRVSVGDIFRLRMGDADRIRIEESCDRLDRIGYAMTGGEIFVDGDVGVQAGRLMAGGSLTLRGNTGPWAASGMKGGLLEILGATDAFLAAPLAGEMVGMRGGLVIVRGRAGERAGDRMRRGTIVIEGEAGAYAGSRMIAGSLIVGRKAGPLPGFLMKRGSIVLGDGCAVMSPTFVDCGYHELLAMRLWAGIVDPHSRKAAALLRRPLQRLAGDMAVLGKGEIFIGSRN